MKLPRYLIVALAVTALLVIWSQFTAEPEEEGPALRTLTQGKPAKQTNSRPAVLTTADPLVDLFPVPRQAVIEQRQKAVRPAEPVKRPEPILSLHVLGAWWDSGERVVILSDGKQNKLLCQSCRTKGYIRPGEQLLPEWILKTLADDHLMVEWQPEHISKRIELDDLKSKPTR
ncbi:hypothetical protein [Serratia odorifera]|uniref:hypothetical protein n=1 Tax=Serratia odorifera TaxID=618 RepID=UPI0018E90953|nr:hypothetical protein [Serratia odorifera]MBJ2066823.1 hypothetical protein [Serratia odorifera]